MKIERMLGDVYSLLNIPIYLYQDSKSIYSFQNLTLPPNLYEIIRGNRKMVLDEISESQISKLKDISELAYIGFKFDDMQIVIGPFLFQEVKTNTITNLKSRLRLIGQEGIMVDNFYNNLRVSSIEEMLFIYHLMNNFSNNVYKQVKFMDVEAKKIGITRKSTLSNLSEELEYVKMNYEVEDQILRIIENGDVESAKDFNTKNIMIKLPKRAANDSLRNLKTRLTILNTICNRAAIRGGIDIQLGHQISTNYGITIEHMKSIFDSVALTNEIVVSYARAVKEYSLNEYSKLIKKAILLIRINLTRKYTLTDLANDLYISKEHLSRRFKKETNMTVANYSNYSKIIEAKKLLDEKSQSIINISNMLGFSNSSYFSKVFKEIVGITPIKYKKKT